MGRRSLPWDSFRLLGVLAPKPSPPTSDVKAAVPNRLTLEPKLALLFASSPRLEASQSLFYGKWRKLSVLARERPLLETVDIGNEPI
jgi:hypothetical protein